MYINALKKRVVMLLCETRPPLTCVFHPGFNVGRFYIHKLSFLNTLNPYYEKKVILF